MHKGMYTYAWDLAEEGIATVAGRLRDAGLDTIVMAASYHAGKFLRPHAPGRKVYFPEDGTVYFRPDMARYGRVKPLVSTLARDTDVLRGLEREVPDMRRVGWTVGLHNTQLGLAFPDLVARNAFGDPLYNSLCPAQPEVRDYLVALCADLGANQGLAEIAIETPGWQAYRHGHHHEFELVELTPAAEILLGMCFCDACRAGARARGIDGDRLMARAARDLEAFFTDGSRTPGDLSADADWQAFLAWRTETVTSLVAEVRQALDRQVALAVIPTVQSPNAKCWVEGSDLPQLAAAADHLEVPAYQAGVGPIAEDVAWVRRTAGEAASIGFIMRPSYPHLGSAAEVAETVRNLCSAGARSIAFYNYGHLRLDALEWVRAALS